MLNEKEHKPILFYIVLVLLLFIITIGGIGAYLSYPFAQKISGNWVSSDQTMNLSSQGQNWELAFPNYQQTNGLTLIYTGVWEAAGVNKYNGSKVGMLSKIDKSLFSDEEIAALQKKSELYTIKTQTDKELTLKYTKKGIEQIQSTTDLNSIVHMTLENLHWDKKKEKLYLNSRYFSNERIEFTLKNEK
ncbi:hypothetical protein C240_937 [Enterococcus sp. 5H]|nr:hypothetical protein [Enterococcus sp. 5H]